MTEPTESEPHDWQVGDKVTVHPLIDSDGITRGYLVYPAADATPTPTDVVDNPTP